MQKPILTLNLRNQKSQLRLNNPQLGQFLTERLAYYADNYRYASAFKTGRWDGKIRFGTYHHPFFIFGTGLLLDVLSILQKNNFDVVIKDERVKPPKQFDTTVSSTLRDYQEAAVESAIKNQRGIVWIPTAGGKTVVFSHLIARLGVPTLVLVRNTDLMGQTMVRLMDDLSLDTIGCIGNGVCQPAEFVTVGMLQTLNKMLQDNPKEFKKAMSYFNCLIVDEAHAINANAKAFTKVVEAIPSFYRYAFTATPSRNERPTATDITIISCFGPVVHKVTRDELVNDGYIVDVVVKIVPNPSKVAFTREDYLFRCESPQGAYRTAWTELILESDVRFKIISNLLLKHPNEQILILCDSVQLAEKLGSMLNVQTVHGSTDRSIRDMVYNEFKAERIRRLVATNIYSEGVDFPGLQVCILAEPFKSPIRLLQRIGRTMRIKEGKGKSIIYDIQDVHLPFFDKQAFERRKLYDREGIIYYVEGLDDTARQSASE